jgi:hypothetical protein
LKPSRSIVKKAVVRPAASPAAPVLVPKQALMPVQKAAVRQPVDNPPSPVARSVCTVNGKTYLMVNCNDPVPEYPEPVVGASPR